MNMSQKSKFWNVIIKLPSLRVAMRLCYALIQDSAAVPVDEIFEPVPNNPWYLKVIRASPCCQPSPMSSDPQYWHLVMGGVVFMMLLLSIFLVTNTIPIKHREVDSRNGEEQRRKPYKLYIFSPAYKNIDRHNGRPIFSFLFGFSFLR